MTERWRAGALQAATSSQALFVRAGLGNTMTATDLQAGCLIPSVGLATMRTAEFVVLRLAPSGPAV